MLHITLVGGRGVTVKLANVLKNMSYVDKSFETFEEFEEHVISFGLPSSRIILNAAVIEDLNRFKSLYYAKLQIYEIILFSDNKEFADQINIAFAGLNVKALYIEEVNGRSLLKTLDEDMFKEDIVEDEFNAVSKNLTSLNVLGDVEGGNEEEIEELDEDSEDNIPYPADIEHYVDKFDESEDEPDEIEQGNLEDMGAPFGVFADIEEEDITDDSPRDIIEGTPIGNEDVLDLFADTDSSVDTGAPIDIFAGTLEDIGETPEVIPVSNQIEDKKVVSDGNVKKVDPKKKLSSMLLGKKQKDTSNSTEQILDKIIERNREEGGKVRQLDFEEELKNGGYTEPVVEQKSNKSKLFGDKREDIGLDMFFTNKKIFLVTGERRTGKTVIAQALAKTLSAYGLYTLLIDNSKYRGFSGYLDGCGQDKLNGCNSYVKGGALSEVTVQVNGRLDFMGLSYEYPRNYDINTLVDNLIGVEEYKAIVIDASNEDLQKLNKLFYNVLTIINVFDIEVIANTVMDLETLQMPKSVRFVLNKVRSKEDIKICKNILSGLQATNGVNSVMEKAATYPMRNVTSTFPYTDEDLILTNKLIKELLKTGW